MARPRTARHLPTGPTAGSVHGPDRRRRWLAVAVAAVVLTGAFTACSDDNGASEKTTSTTAAATGGGGVQEARRAVSQNRRPPSQWPLSTPTSKPVPAGRTIVFIHCGTLACNTSADGVRRAAEALKWNFRVISADGTVAGARKAWRAAVRIKPAAVIGSGFTMRLFRGETEQLQKAGAFVGAYATDDSAPGNGVDMLVGGRREISAAGRQQAEWIVADSAGKARALLVHVPRDALLGVAASAFTARMRELCRACGVERFDLPAAALGHDAAERVAKRLQSRPGTDYAAFTVDAATVGLPDALLTAGLTDKVTYTGFGGEPANLAAVASGDQGAEVTPAYYEDTAALVYGAALKVSGDSLAPARAYRAIYWTHDKTNAGKTTEFAPSVPGLYQSLARLAGVSK